MSSVKQPVIPSFAEAIAKSREEMGLSQAALGKRIRVKQANYSLMERGLAEPRWSKGVRIILTLGLPLERFLPADAILAAAKRLVEKGAETKPAPDTESESS